MQLNGNRQYPTREMLHGKLVADPFRWLEDRNLKETEEWIAEQQKKQQVYFSGVHSLPFARARIHSYLRRGSWDQPARVNSLLFFRHRSLGREQASIYVRDQATNEVRTLVDPSPLGQFASVAIHRISKDGGLLAYELKLSGSDTLSVAVVETATGSAFPERLPDGQIRGMVFAPNDSGFYYCHDERHNSAADHMIRFHRFGTDHKIDGVIFRKPRQKSSGLSLVGNELMLVASHKRDSVVDLYLKKHDHDEWVCIAHDHPHPFSPIIAGHRIFALTRDRAPNLRIVEICADETIVRDLIPEFDTRIQNAVVSRNIICVGYEASGVATIRAWSIGQNDEQVLAKGAVRLLPSLAGEMGALFYTSESFVHAPQIYEFDSASKRSSASFGVGIRTRQRHAVERLTYQSKDGTWIPVDIVYQESTLPMKSRPAIMSSYGAFGASMMPSFSVLATVMLELGAVLVLPSIRGGSEYGEAWHDAARGRNRQVAFDDFIAAAEWLVSSGLVSPRHIAIFGASNGGLLVGAAMTQRPDLYRAVLCIAPLLDMVRYEHFDDASRWKREFGTVSDAEDFKVLHGYSPYHQVKSTVNYPASLFVSGDSDDRCNPAHVRKMAAALQGRAAQEAPIIVDYSQKRGHSPTMPLSIRVEALARRVAFLCSELEIQVPSGEQDETIGG